MARLVIPGMPGVQSLQGPNPARRQREGRQLQFAFETVAGTGRQATAVSQQAERIERNRNRQVDVELTQFFEQEEAVSRRMEQDENDANMSIEFSEWMAEASSNPVLSAQEARELGYEGAALTNADSQDREEIEIWEVLPDVARAKYDALTEKYGANMSDPVARQEWTNRRRVMGAEIYSRLRQTQATELWNSRIRKHETAIERAQMAGDWGMALELAASHPDSGVRDELIMQVEHGQEMATIHNVYQSGNPAAMMQQAAKIKDPSYSGPLSETQQTAAASMLEQGAIQVVSAQEQSRIQEFEAMWVQYEVQKRTDDPQAWETLAAMENTLRSMDRMDYVGKGFWAREFGALAEAAADAEDFSMVGQAWSLGQPSGVDITNNKHKKHIDQMVVASIQRAVESGDDSAVQQVHGSNLRSAARVGYVPEYYMNRIMDLNLDSLPVGEAIEAATFYNSLAQEASHLVAQMPEETRRTAQEIYSLGMAGRVDEDTLAAIRQRYRDTSEETLEFRDKSFNAEYQKDGFQGKMFRDYLDRKIEGWAAYIPFYDRGYKVSDQTYIDFATSVRHHYMNGSNMEDALNLGWQDWSNSHQVTEVNGKKEMVRHSPELMFGHTTEEIRGDFNAYLRSAIDGIQGDLSEFEIYPDLRTGSQNPPSYQVYHRNPSTDELTMVYDPESGYLRYTPDSDKIVRTSREKEIRESRIKHEIKMGIRQAPTPLEKWLRSQEQEPDSDDRQSESRARYMEQRSKEMAADRAVLKDLYNES